MGRNPTARPDRQTAYVASAVDDECANLAATRHGRNDAINRAAFALGRFVGGGSLNRSEVEQRLYDAAQASGYIAKDGPGAAKAAIKSGLDKGILQPRTVPDDISPATPRNVVALRPKPSIEAVPVPDWTEPRDDGRPKFISIGQSEPTRFSDEARRHLYVRDGQVVRVKIKKTDRTWGNWYLCRRPSDGKLGWQAAKPVGFIACPYLPKGARNPFKSERIGEVLAWTEGERDCDSLHRYGIAAFTFGGSTDTPDLTGLLEGHNVVVAVDNDSAGLKSIGAKIGAVIQAGAASVRLWKCPELADGGKDATDYFEAGGTAEDFLDLAERIDPTTWKGPEATVEIKRRSERKRRERRGDDPRPIIKVAAGEIAQAVDAAEDALIARGGLFQRGNQIVLMGEAPMKTHDDREVTASRIFECGEFALAERIAEAAVVMKYDKREKVDVVVNPPTWLVKTLQQRTGHFQFPVLTAIINTPTLRQDGSLLATPGYDPATGLFLDTRGVTFPAVPLRPSRRDAETALGELRELLSGFPFEDEAGRAVALSAILTATVRQGLRTAPLHAFSAPTAGSGKSKLVDIASVIATGREAGVVAQVGDDAEMEKRLGAQLLEGASTIAIDNCTHPIDGNLLCSALTQSVVDIRPLGGSKKVTVPTNVLLTATGNNLVIAGDMTRRAIIGRLNPGVERPELREFLFEPVERAKANRVRYVVAALTILLAFKEAGAPPQAKPLGAFEGWSKLVRDSLIWLKCGDPVSTMEKARELDPKLHELAEVIAQWKESVGKDRITVRKLIEKATRSNMGAQYGDEGFVYPDLREALLSVAGQGGTINGRRLGKWLAAHAKRIVGGFHIEDAGTDCNTVAWRLVEQKSNVSRTAERSPLEGFR